MWEQQSDANEVSCNSSFIYFHQALQIFGMDLSSAFTIKIYKFKFNILDLAFRDFKRSLIQLARPKKDFFKSSQFLDFELTITTRNNLKKQNSPLTEYCISGQSCTW